MPVAVKRVYEPASRSDGARVLVDRLWPRGLAKATAALDEPTRERLIEKLTESNVKLERFAYVASHDMQEPLRMIANFSKLIEAEYGTKLDAEGKEYIHIVTESATRMQNMVDDLLEYARIGNDTAIPQGSRSPLESVLEPPNHFAVLQAIHSYIQEAIIILDVLIGDVILFQKGAHFTVGVGLAPVGVVHAKAPWIAQQHVVRP